MGILQAETVKEDYIMACHPSHVKHLPKLNRIEGQIKAVKTMIEEERYCMDILLLLKSVNGAVHRLQQEIFKTHMESCVNEAFCTKDCKKKEEKIKEILKLWMD